MTPTTLPTGSLSARTKGKGWYFEAMWRVDGRLVSRRIGPAWVTDHESPDARKKWKAKRGRAPEGQYTEKTATVRMAELIREHAQEQGIKRSKRDATFTDASDAWLDHLSRADRSKPSTLADYRNMFARPGEKLKRGSGEKKARILRHFGDRPLRSIDTADIEAFLTGLEREGLNNRLINKYRAVLQTLFNYCRKPLSGYELTSNPVSLTEKRHELDQEEAEPFAPEEVAAIVRAAESGEHQTEPDSRYGEVTRADWRASNLRDATLFEVAALTAMRQAELRALRWKDLDFQQARITIARSVSNDKITTPKSNKKRVIPMPDTAARRFEQLSRRDYFIGKNDLIFGNSAGEVQCRSALLRRFKRAQEAAGVEQRSFHDLRHSFLTWTAGAGFASREVQEFAGHSSLRTTDRYLHYRPQRDAADRIEAIYNPEPIETSDSVDIPQGAN